MRYEVVGEADDGAEAVKLYNELLPDVATIDISMPKMDGIAALKAIRAAHPNAKVVTVGAMNSRISSSRRCARGRQTSS